MSSTGERTIEGASVMAGFLWPAFASMELFAGSYTYPIAAFAAAYLVGGMRPFWNAGFQQFLHGYMAGGAIYGASVYMRTDKWADKVTAVEWVGGAWLKNNLS